MGHQLHDIQLSILFSVQPGDRGKGTRKKRRKKKKKKINEIKFKSKITEITMKLHKIIVKSP